MNGSWLGISLVLGVLAGLVGGLALWRRIAQPHPELTRKVVHVGMGLVSLTLPWLFAEAWPVMILAVLGAGGLLLLRVGRLRDNLGAVLGGVGRSSLGEVCFAAGVAALFVLFLREEGSPGRRLVLYVVPLLLLGIADAAAALVGVRCGRWHYRTAADSKTVEGSASFLVCAFVGTLVPLLVVGEVTLAQSVLIAGLLGSLTMFLEAVGTHGLDNLLIPLGAFLLLRGMLDLAPVYLACGLALVAVLTGLLVLSPARPGRGVMHA